MVGFVGIEEEGGMDVRGDPCPAPKDGVGVILGASEVVEGVTWVLAGFVGIEGRWCGFW
jgi:hypothetical protein